MTIATLRTTYISWLKQRFDGVYTNRNDAIIVPNIGTTAVILDVTDLPDGAARLNIRAAVLTHLELSPELLEYVAVHGGDFLFGGLSMYIDEDDPPMLEFDYSIFADVVNQQVLEKLVGIVGSTAINLGPQLKSSFGGKFVYDD